MKVLSEAIIKHIGDYSRSARIGDNDYDVETVLDSHESLRSLAADMAKALESIEWTTGYLDGSKDYCRAYRGLVYEALATYKAVITD